MQKEYTRLPNEKVYAVGEYYKGAKHDVAIFIKRLNLHMDMLKRNDGSGFCSVIADKRYQGREGYIGMIIPKKGYELCSADERRNRNIGRVRIICENYYGRLKKL